MHDHESSDHPLTDPELSAFEASLASLAPQWKLDRDRLMFEAGRRTAGVRLRRTTRLLVATSLALGGLAGFMLLEHTPERPMATDKKFPHSAPNELSADEQNDRLSVASTEGPTNQRLLRLWGQDGKLFDPLAESPGEPAIVPKTDIDLTSPNTSRELLLRYLQSTTGRL